MADMSENPFGEKTTEALLQVYFEVLDKLITEDNLSFGEFLSMPELKERLSELQLPPELRRDINRQMINNGIMSDDTLQALTERLFTQKKKEGN